MINEKREARLRLAEAILVYQIEKARVIVGRFLSGPPFIDPYLPFKAEQAAQLAYFKALGYECKPHSKPTIRKRDFIFIGTPPRMIDEDKEKLAIALEKAGGISVVNNV